MYVYILYIHIHMTCIHITYVYIYIYILEMVLVLFCFVGNERRASICVNHNIQPSLTKLQFWICPRVYPYLLAVRW